MTDAPICVTITADTKEVYQNYLHSYYIFSIMVLTWKMYLYVPYEVLDFQFHLTKLNVVILGEWYWLSWPSVRLGNNSKTLWGEWEEEHCQIEQ